MLTVIWSIVLVVLGINALIIIHELGHFLVARACGVRCEKFYIWFDFWGLKFFKFRWGETEYGLGVFPLGGYVKMLGQEDNPGELAAELERAKNATATDDTSIAPRDVAALERAIYAPDSYLAKSVPQRMAIISAGVIMNFLFAFVCAAGAYGLGFKQVAPYAGGVVAGSPAWQADIQAGDKLEAIGGRAIPSFGDLRQMVLDAGGTVSLRWSRPSTSETFTRDLFEAQNKGDLLPSIGVFPLRTLDVYREVPISPTFESFYAPEVRKQLGASKYRVAAIDGNDVASYAEFARSVNSKLGEPVECSFVAEDATAPLTVTLPAVPMKTLEEIRFAMGPITAIQNGSTAAAAGVEVGDTIVAVEGIETLDPLRLPYQVQRRANSVAENGGAAERRITLQNARGERRDVTVLMNLHGEYTEPRSLKDVLALAPLGIAYSVPPRLASGERVTDIIFRDVDEPPFAKSSFSGWMSEGMFFGPRIGFAIHRLGDAIDIPFVMLAILQECKTQTPIRLIVDGTPRECVISEATDWHRAERGLILNSETFTMRADSFLSACSLGWGRMVESSLAVFTFLANLGNRVSAKAMGGPVAIVGIAYSVANEGPALFLLFLCLIGANLAVINLLPIPVLDGGHLVFLAYEAIFRKPPNENIQIALSYLGLFLILGLMIWSFSLDLGFIPRM